MNPSLAASVVCVLCASLANQGSGTVGSSSSRGKRSWRTEKIAGPLRAFTPQLGFLFGSGMNRIANAENIRGFLAQTDRLLAVQPSPTEDETKTSSLHDQVKEKLREIGRLQECLSETECKINGERLDVAWRRVAASVPQKVFEVQVSGNLWSAVGKLKKAHLLWNSQPFLVLQRAERPKADDLLAGPFLEIKKSVIVRDIEAVDELYIRVKRADESRQQFGL
jgi:hypothetical protein